MRRDGRYSSLKFNGAVPNLTLLQVSTTLAFERERLSDSEDPGVIEEYKCNHSVRHITDMSLEKQGRATCWRFGKPSHCGCNTRV